MQKKSRPTVLITGSSGFLGQAIAQGLLQRYRVIGLDARRPRQPIEGMDTLDIDLTSEASIVETMTQGSYRLCHPSRRLLRYDR